RFYNFWDDNEMGFWKDVKVLHQDKKVKGGEFTLRFLPFPSSTYGVIFNFFSSQILDNVDSYIYDESFKVPGITDLQYDKNKIVQYTMNNNYQPITPILFGESGNIEELTMVFSYIPQQFISSDIKKL